MLRLHFINVGDGDAILVEELREGSAFRMLVDTGREDVGGEPGSLRRTAAEYLAELGIGLKSMSVPVKSLSGGERQALAVAKAVTWAHTALIIDRKSVV